MSHKLNCMKERSRGFEVSGSFCGSQEALEGKAEHDGDEGARGSIGIVFIWLQTLPNKIERLLEMLRKGAKLLIGCNQL